MSVKRIGGHVGARGARGFTLIEIMVAMLILGIMSALGYGAYRAARISAQHTEESLQRSREIEFGMRVLAQDFSESVPRPVRDILGSQRIPALLGTGGAGTVSPAPASSTLGSSSSSSLSSSSSMTFNSNAGFGSSDSSNALPIVQLSRAGWSNTAGQQRGTLQRVSYALVGDVLKRSYQANLDVVQGTKPTSQDLLTGVKGVQLRYLDGNQAWQNNWPPVSTVSQDPLQEQMRPVAVEIVVEFKDWGRIRRLIEVAG